MINFIVRGLCRRRILSALSVIFIVGLAPIPFVLASSANLTFLPMVSRHTSNYYVAPDGSDTNPGTIDAPWKHPQFAVETAPTGASIYLRAGSYRPMTIERSGLTLLGYPGETAIISGDGVEQHTIMIRNTSDVSIRSLTIQDNPIVYGTGIHVENSHDILISSNLIQSNQGFGVVLKDVVGVIVEYNEITDNANGIEVRYGSDGVVLRDNQVHNNHRRVDSGRAAIGINFYYTTGPVYATGNWVWENYLIGASEREGAAFEVYAATNVTISGNVIWDNETILETGTDNDKTLCANITFTRNIAVRGIRQQGLILRCAADSLVTHNTFIGLDNFVFDLSHYKGEYGASIEGLQILNNIALNGRVYAIETELPASVVIDYNLIYNPGSDSDYGEYLAYVEGFGNTNLFSEFQNWTGYEAHGVNSDPLFVDQPNGDYHLTETSPAIDQGLPLGDPFQGSAPDLGRYEYNALNILSKIHFPLDNFR
jgi:parallel beta-helix repeat protein